MENKNSIEAIPKNYNLTELENFSKNSLVGTREDAYNQSSIYGSYRPRERYKDYTREDIDRIISSNDVEQQKTLSRAFFLRDGIYKGYILYYATLLNYTGILIPSPSAGQSLQSSANKKRYNQAVDFIDRIPIKVFCENAAQKALTDGSYFGVIQTLDKNTFSFLDLPSAYCRSRFKDIYGNDLIEFNLQYFRSISDEGSRQIALDTYPEEITREYYAWKDGKRTNSWMIIPADIGICFPMFEGHPYFLSTIPQILDLEEALEISRERDLEEIRKIIVQKIPHNNENALLFEPDEAVEIHNGTVSMMKGNQNVSVLTTYADVDAIVSKTSSDSGSDTVKNTESNVARQSTVSDQIFASSGSTTLSSSIRKDISIMMTLANKFSLFFTNMINRLYANSNLCFKYEILPISEQLKEDFIKDAKELASLGYSQIMPALAMGISQNELYDLKCLENDVLNLQEVLIPLQSSYTQSADSGDAGAPKKKDEDKAEQTVKNETSKGNAQGGSKQ